MECQALDQPQFAALVTQGKDLIRRLPAALLAQQDIPLAFADLFRAWRLGAHGLESVECIHDSVQPYVLQLSSNLISPAYRARRRASRRGSCVFVGLIWSICRRSGFSFRVVS